MFCSKGIPHSGLFCLFPFFIQRLLISNWLLWDEPRPFSPHRPTLKERFKELWHGICAWGWILLWKHPCPWRRQHDAGWWQPVWEAGSLWHLLLREFSRWRITFCFAACSALQAPCAKSHQINLSAGAAATAKVETPPVTTRWTSAALSEGVDSRAQMAVGQWT